MTKTVCLTTVWGQNWTS